jgi:hypothetical protein
MNRLGTKLQIGTATLAVAAAAVLTPLPTAQAANPGSLGGSAGGGAELIAITPNTPDCDPTTSSNCATTVAPAIAPNAAALPSLLPGGGSILQNPLWWFGPPNPTPPTQTPVFTFYPLNLLPGFIRPLFSWFADINYEVCIVGLTLRIGPYGAISGSYGRGCA